MNTGEIIETNHLLLKPGKNATDNEPFLRMLSQDGSFRDFCGLPLTDTNLSMFEDYFEIMGDEHCLYSIYHKESDTFIGYVGYHREGTNYELEFYVSREYRRRGFCEEACVAAMNKLFDDGVSVNGHIIRKEKLYATTLVDNVATIGLLEKLGFEKYVKSDDGAILITRLFWDEESDEILTLSLITYEIDCKRFRSF